MKPLAVSSNHAPDLDSPGKPDRRPSGSPSRRTKRDPAWQHLVYELAPLAYLNFDSTGRILNFNAAASRLLGANHPRDLRRPLADFFVPRHRSRILSHVRQSDGSRTAVVTRLRLRLPCDPASGVEVEMSTRPASRSFRYRTQLLPVSDSGPADDAKFRALVENSNEVICIGAPDGTIFYTTPSVRRVLGYDPASWFGRNAFEIMPKDQAKLASNAVRKLAGAPTGSVIRLTTQVRHFDGSWRWVEAVLTNLIGQPAVGGIVCNYRDITDSRLAEEERERILEQRVRARTGELREANRELSAEITERTRLEREIIRISEREQRRIGQELHDGLCQELTAIAFMTRALATRLGKEGGRGQAGAGAASRINDVARLLNESVARCRDIARGLHPVEMDSDGLMVALNGLATRTHQIIPCSFRCKEPILMRESDVALNLYRIALEAVNNAVKYSRAKQITISLERDGGATRLCISDDGRGVPKRVGSRNGNGGGMGLHIMRYRARTMGAALRVDALRPRGTEVVCILPV